MGSAQENGKHVSQPTASRDGILSEIPHGEGCCRTVVESLDAIDGQTPIDTNQHPDDSMRVISSSGTGQRSGQHLCSVAWR